MSIKIKWIAGLLGGVLFSSSLFAQVEERQYNNPIDPYERFNRVIFSFNEVVDKSIVKPLATLYNKIMPKPLNKGISSFFTNIDTIPAVANDMLQGNFYQATSDSWRLGINSTVGILGFFDMASDMGLEPNSEDFGLTLAQWGYKDSTYIVIPFLGPSTVRDGVGFFINYQLLTIYPYINPVKDRYRLYLFGVLQRRAELVRFQNVLEQAAVDKYVFMRDAYMQRRSYQIQRNKELGNPYLNNEDKENNENRLLSDASNSSV